MTIKKCDWDILFFITGIIGGIMLITGVILTYYFEWGKQTIWPGLAVVCASDIGFKLTNRSARNEEKIKTKLLPITLLLLIGLFFTKSKAIIIIAIVYIIFIKLKFR